MTMVDGWMIYGWVDDLWMDGNDEKKIWWTGKIVTQYET